MTGNRDDQNETNADSPLTWKTLLDCKDLLRTWDTAPDTSIPRKKVQFGVEIRLRLQNQAKASRVRLKKMRAALDETHKDGPGDPPSPPWFAESLLALCLSPSKSDAIIGDLAELFERDCERYDPRRARRFYRSRTLRSLWPVLWRAFQRLIKWGVIAEAWRR